MNAFAVRCGNLCKSCADICVLLFGRYSQSNGFVKLVFRVKRLSFFVCAITGAHE